MTIDERIAAELRRAAPEVDENAAWHRIRSAAGRRGHRRSLRLALATVPAVLLLVVGIALFSSLDSDPDPAVAPQPSEVATGSWRLAYEVEGDIYLADWDGANAVLVADGVSTEDGCGGFRGEGTMWAPDGRHFAYRSGWDDTCPGEVHVRDAEGRLVTSVPGMGWDIGWSPDSTRFATWIELWETIGIYGLDGERQALLTVTPGCSGGGDIDPLWSPDGKSVIVPPCKLPIDGGTPLRTTASENLVRSTTWAASWAPDGTRIAYMSSTGADETYDSSLVIAEASGTVLQIVDEELIPGPWYWYLVWSPSGDRVVFSRVPRGADGDSISDAIELRQVDVDSGQVTTLAAFESGIRAIRFSPDGDRILFTTVEESEGVSPQRLWSMYADGSDVQLLVPNTGFGDWQPRPSGD